MVDVINSLKANARILHRSAQAGDSNALHRIKRHLGIGLLPDFDSQLKRRHCLKVVARELGFDGWGHVTSVIEGKNRDDFGTLLSPARCSVHQNIWCASYKEAKALHNEKGGYLLAYKNQYLIVDAHFIETLGLEPDDKDWSNIGYNWARPGDIEARKRLYAKLAADVLAGPSPDKGERP
jgi:hypothetical protein